MSAFTAVVHQITKAPKRITLLGDKTKRPEPAQHVIEFPGGAVEVSRCSDGSYWAHIIVNSADIMDDCEGRVSAFGKVMGSRIDRATSVDPIPNETDVRQIAVLIRARKDRR